MLGEDCPRVEAGRSGLIFSEIPPDAWARTMAVNVNGPFFMARVMHTKKAANGRRASWACWAWTKCSASGSQRLS